MIRFFGVIFFLFFFNICVLLFLLIIKRYHFTLNGCISRLRYMEKCACNMLVNISFEVQ